MDRLDDLEESAEKGDAQAAFSLAMLYHDGSKEVRRNEEIYALYIRVCADADPCGNQNAASKVALACLLCARGLKYGREGFQRDTAKSNEYYIRAADGIGGEGSGHPLACRMVGRLYAKGGDGFEKDSAKAWHYLKLAAKGGDGPSMVDVAEAYLNGSYGETDKAVAQQYLYGYIMRERNEKERSSFVDYSEYEGKSILLYTDKILHCDAQACLDLLMNLPENFGAPIMRDALIGWYFVQRGALEAALPYLLRGVKNENPLCAGCLGLMYAQGEGVKADLAQAKYYLEMGAEQGDEACREALEELNNSKGRLKRRKGALFVGKKI